MKFDGYGSPRGIGPLAALREIQRRPVGGTGQPAFRRGRDVRRRHRPTAIPSGRIRSAWPVHGSQILRDAAGDIDDHVHCIFEYAIQGYVDDQEIPPKARKKIALQFDMIIGNEFDGYGETVLGRQGSLVLENEQKAMLFHTSDVDKNLRVVGEEGRQGQRRQGRARDRGAQGRQGRRRVAKPSAGWPCKGPTRASPPSWSIGPSAASRRRTTRPARSPAAMPRPASTPRC